MSNTGANPTPTDSRAMIEWLFSNSQELLSVIGPDGRFKLVNPAWRRATGWDESDLLEQTVISLIHPDDQEDVARLAASLETTGVGENIARVLMKDGSWRWFEGRSQRTEDGYIIGALRDVTAEQIRAAELEEAQRARKHLSQAAGIVSWTYEPATNSLTWSDEFTSITGRLPHEVARPDQFFDLTHPDETARVEAAFMLGIRQGSPGSLEHQMLTKSGRWTTWRATFHTEARPGGIYALKGLSQDITELARARDAAVAGERQIRQLIEDAPFAVAMFDRDMRYMVVSKRWRVAFNLTSRPHLGLHFGDVFGAPPKRFMEAHRRALAGESVTCDEDRFTDGSGARHWVRWEARPWLDPAGDVAGVLCYVDDISGVAQARYEAQANAQRLKIALQAAEAGVYEIDHVNKTFWASPEFSRVVGQTTSSYDQALKLQFPKFHPDDIEHARASFLALRDQGASGSFEARVVRSNGESRWVRVFHTVRRRRDGRASRAVGMVQDFDLRKRQELALIEAERAAQAGAEAKAAFLANMSHEIRTPLNGVMGVLHLLKSEGLSAEGRSLLEEALSCGLMLAELLNDVIDFSKIEAGHLELAYEPVDPAGLIASVARLLRPQAEAKGLTIEVETEAAPGWVRSDPVRLRQALFNLIGNAVKFTLDGSVTVRASRVRGPSGQMLRFEVIDTGVGIPEEVQPRIFQRFDQGDASTTRQFGGSGLGLAITKRLAEMMGGAVGFTSVAGQGSTFWLEVAAESVQADAVADEKDEAFLEGLKVLVVEDNATNRLIATKLLERLGARVQTAADGMLGVEAAAQGDFDLILMDIQMPGIDGMEAARRIRELPSPASQAAIVALTANVLSHQRQTYLDAGMDGVVGKPISPTALLAEIARLGGPPADLEGEAA